MRSSLSNRLAPASTDLTASAALLWRQGRATLITCSCLMGLLTGCSKAPVESAKPTEGKTPATATSTESATPGSAQTAGETPGGTALTKTAPSGANAPLAGTGSTAGGAAPLPSQIKININELPDDITICTVSGEPIKVGDYRRMMKVQQLQLQGSIASNQLVRAQLLAEAKRRGLTLTAEEKSKLIASSKSEYEKNGKDFQTFLKEKHISQADYDREINDVGLVYKMSNVLLEEGLLPELVNRQLLSEASVSAGLENKAMNTYLLMKHSKNFEQLKQSTGLSGDSLKGELVKAELAKMQVQKIERGVRVSDADVRKFYNNNKALFKHGERIRLSSLLVAAPEMDEGPIQSIRTQVQAANPKLTGKDLDATIAQVMQNQQQKALILLGRAKGGENFATLCNENTDDITSKIKKNGGDLGFQERGQLIPQFADAVWGLKAGDVLPKLVKTGLGFQIIKVSAREKPGTLPLDDVRPLIEEKVKQDKVQLAVNNWINDRRRSVKIEFSPRFIAAATKADSAKVATP